MLTPLNWLINFTDGVPVPKTFLFNQIKTAEINSGADWVKKFKILSWLSNWGFTLFQKPKNCQENGSARITFLVSINICL